MLELASAGPEELREMTEVGPDLLAWPDSEVVPRCPVDLAAFGRGRFSSGTVAAVERVSIEESADVDATVTIGSNSHIWHLAQVREHAHIGANCVVGRGVYIGPHVEVGDGCKIQNDALVYDPARLGRGVFIGPAVVLTNDVYPRAVNPDLTPKRADGWDSAGVTVGDGASIGARSVVLAGVTIGDWALVGAGSTVIRDVPAHALVVGSPAAHIGWVGRTGRRLEQVSADRLRCSDTGDEFAIDGASIRRLGATQSPS